MRINLDMPRTRRREDILLGACLRAKQNIVIDNTNVSRQERAKYIALAKQFHFSVIGFYFDLPLEVCLERNAKREKAIPRNGLIARFKALEEPTMEEGFDILSVFRE